MENDQTKALYTFRKQWIEVEAVEEKERKYETAWVKEGKWRAGNRSGGQCAEKWREGEGSGGQWSYVEDILWELSACGS